MKEGEGMEGGNKKTPFSEGTKIDDEQEKSSSEKNILEISAKIKHFFPKGIPLLNGAEFEKETRRSPYHDFRTCGYVTWGNRYKSKAEPISEALVVNAGEGMVYDPKYVVSDIWGNLHVYDENGDVIDRTEWITRWDDKTGDLAEKRYWASWDKYNKLYYKTDKELEH